MSTLRFRKPSEIGDEGQEDLWSVSKTHKRRWRMALILETDLKNGINGCEADLIHRQSVFGANKYQKPPPKRFLRFVFNAFKDTTILILLACAVLSLGFGIKQHGWEDGWYDGGSIILAVFLVVVFGICWHQKHSVYE